MQPRQLADMAGRLANEKKADRPVILDLTRVSIMTDYFVIASAQSRVQAAAIADHIELELKQHGIVPMGKELDQGGKWLLLDYGNIIVHIFQEEARQFYNLERLWGEAPLITL
jgi:ribosome-associated protein